MNKANTSLMIGSYICGLNSELYLHTVIFQLESNKCRKAIAF